MSDVWPSGFSGVNFTYGKFQQVTSEFGETVNDDDVDCLCGLVFSNEEPAKAMMHAINNHDRLLEENKRLRHKLVNLIYMAENNTGNEPSLNCFHLAIDEAKQLLLNQLKAQNNDK